MIEKVQMRATKLVDGFGSLSYEDRLRKLELPTLVYRRARGDVIEVYKHLNIYDKDTAPPRFTISRAVRGHDHHLIWNRAKDGTRGKQTNSFYFRTIPEWNVLPDDAVNSTTLNAFKNQLDDAWKDKPWKYEYNCEQE